MNILEENIGLIRAQLHIGEVPKALDTQVDKAAGHGLSHMLGNGKHRHIGPIVGNILLQLVHGADGDSMDAGADEVGGDIKGGVYMEADLFKVEVLQQSVAQMAYADDDKAVALVDAQDMPDLGAKLGHIVAIALLAELTKAAQVLPNLGGGNVHLVTQRVGGDTDHALVVQVVQGHRGMPPRGHQG